MSKNLVIVESPAKARTIKKLLGSNYSVKASNGHVRDLPKGDLGVDTQNGFEPKYVQLRASGKVVKAIREAAKKADRVLLASDPDREGEAIGWHIAQLLKSLDKPVERIVFNAITKNSVREAAKHPRPIDENLVNAQQARRILDRLVGYELSPLLQWRVRRGLSAGRVQSVAVRMVCDREAEIREFVPEEYWTLDAFLATQREESFTARLNTIDGEKAEVSNEETMNRILANLDGAEFRVDNIERKETKRRPYPPFITSTLQQEAWRKLRFRTRRTMQLAQQLYEGVSLGEEGLVGVITYMRTDSTRLAPEAISDVRAFIGRNFEPAMLPEKPNFYRSKKGAQDAHEAIRPTSAFRTPDQIKAYLTADQLKLYTLIWKRFVASQMSPALLDQTAIDVAARKYVFRATGTVVKFPGFTKLYEETDEDKENGENGQNELPEVNQGEAVSLNELKPEQHFTKPPPRYSEATLVRALEQNGIGRPSTYAPTINTIQERKYVTREKGRLKPTPLGEEVNAILVKHFPDILDLNFTAGLEEDLDKVEEGQRHWRDLLRTFYDGFSQELSTAQKKMVENVTDEPNPRCPECGGPMELSMGRFGPFFVCSKSPECTGKKRVPKPRNDEPTDEVCEKCGGQMVIREGRFGRFMACSNYPKCRNTYNIDENGNKVEREPKPAPKRTDQKCPKCDGTLVIRRSRQGDEFYGCENYPKCKFTKPKETGLKCVKPGCDGNLVSRRGKRRRFLGCDKYPECNLMLFGQPDKEFPCPKCGNSWTLVAKPRNKPHTRSCPAPSCNYSEEIPED